ncbi:MAG: efflux RND transporter permease subunit [Armatimonadetes bacterium]|nr:efflux RND transporter permease subunit [Armatimonadota bacterium]
MNLTKAAITRPVFVLMIMLAAIILGWKSYTSMRLEQNPDVSFGVVTIVTSYPGAGPEEINNLVSRKVEEAVSGVEGIREVTSTSREGFSLVVCSFEIGVDADRALNDVRSKVDTVINSLPKDALKPTVSKQDTSSQPVLYLSFSSSKLSSRDLRDLIDDKLKDRFGQIPGVASADVLGGDLREIQVRLKLDKLVQYGIGIADIERVVNAATLNVPAGKLLSGTQEYSVRVQGEFKSVDELRNLVFSVSNPRNPGGKGQLVHLSDVATIEDTIAERTRIARMNGNDSIVLALSKTKEGNAVDITSRADEVIKGISKEYADENIGIVKTFESGKLITESLDDLRFALFFGIVLVAVIVYLFLHNFRGTLIVCLAIPTSIFATFIAMKGLGFTVNNLSMLALSLAIGVLVDDAIVVLENINRHLRLGEDPKEAALNGRAEIGLAAIAITMADVVVFMPIGFMGGIVGQFFKPLALSFVAATLFSLFVSFTLTPMLASRWYRAGEDMENVTGKFSVWFEKTFHSLEQLYRRVLEWALNHRWFVFILGNIALVTVFQFIGGGFTGLNPKASIGDVIKGEIQYIVIAEIVALIAFVCNLVFFRRLKPKFFVNALLFGLIFPAVAVVGFFFGRWKQDAPFKFAFLPSSDSGQVAINIEMPADSNLQATDRVVRLIENKIKDIKDVKYVLSNIGSQSAGSFSTGNSGSNYAQIQLALNDKASFMDRLKMAFGQKSNDALRLRDDTSVAAETTRVVGKIPGAITRISAADSFGFGAALQMSFRCDDRELLTQTVNKIYQRLADHAIPGVINPEITSKPGKPELQAVPDRSRLADAGLTVAEVGNAVRTLYQGNDDTKYRLNGREYPIRVMMDYSDRNNPNLFTDVPVKFNHGLPITLGSVMTTINKPALDKIDRRDRIEELRLNASMLPGYAAGTVQAQIDKLIKDEHLVPDGVKYKPLGQADAQARESGYMISAFLFGLMLVYMVLASLYDNLLYPFIIQLAQPQAMVGALLALIFTDKAFSLVGFIGLVSLIGLVGKNAILVVDYTNTLRARGLNRHDALVQAGPTRLRPITMTTLALVLGTLPVALALGRGSEFRETIGITIIGGISLSTLLTLLVIPCSYTIFDDLSIGIGKVMGRLRRSTEGTPPPARSTSSEDEPTRVLREP